MTQFPKRIGFYLWGGPNTIRLLETKYHQPKIDIDSHYRVYDYTYLHQAQQLLGITDLWMTWSWGFSDTIEKLQYTFTREKIINAKKLGLKTYAYIQGFNVVTKDFKDKDFFCHDWNGKLLPYSKDRSFICPNNPKAIEHIIERIRIACNEPFDCIYIDNIIFGIYPWHIAQNFTTFFGCQCTFCKKKFSKIFSYQLQRNCDNSQQIKDYLKFRSESMTEVLTIFSNEVRKTGREFGINLYDFFRHTSPVYFGYDFKLIESLLDYYLLENHAFINETTINNSSIASMSQSTKPVFVLSYQHGIGCEPQFTQQHLNTYYSDAVHKNYYPCIKGSEFTTNNIWHSFRFESLHRPIINETVKQHKNKTTPIHRDSFIKRRIFGIIDLIYPTFLRYMYQNKLLHRFIHNSGIYSRALRSIRNYQFD